MRVVAAGRTEVGCVRKHNEDNFLMEPDLGLFVVADGLGGHAAGEVASQIVVEKIGQFITHTVERDRTWPVEYDTALPYDGNRLKAALLLADQSILNDIRANPERESMGSTVVACLVNGETVTLVHVGDSRAYLLNAEGIQQVTRDHSWVAEQVANGILTPDEARRHPFRNVITQALGNGGELDISVREIQAKELDRILLCSDGLSGMIQDQEIWEIVQSAPDMDEAAGRLIAKAMGNGGEDNITVVIIAFDPDKNVC
ncbi:Stp1/IreP family PP2C-type Ser/Thr phosphatase [Mesoterricola silvestris]|uniref:Protein-serine/threonine phosphatase n=1 Tax=Mesoterricola silvestris TaxID=2927979 RepID=A0AA48GQQ2_9BACT|nr:Stp1/IreP family PP2C-type Ser/Thr phosphatase [Mesoterricola silvestris]BDU72465.1 protein-serine/threonine phosphatase [Mesoterricola silvestris]